MEQKQINKIFASLVGISFIFSLSALAFAYKSYLSFSLLTKNSQQNTQTLPISNNESEDSSVVSGPTQFMGFVGKPSSTSVNSSNDEKIIELKGHVMTDPKAAIEKISDSDQQTQKVVINKDTKIYYIADSQDGNVPVISMVTFDQFSPSTDEIYVAKYEAEDGQNVTPETPAHSISIFSGTQNDVQNN